MKKSNKLIVISLVATIAIYGTYKVVLADNNSEQKLVQKISEKINEQNTSEDFTQEENKSKIKAIVKKVFKKKPTEKINMDEISLESEEFDDSNCSNPIHIPNADEICEKRYEYELISDGTIEGRKKSMMQKAIEIRDEAFGGESAYDNPEIGENVCKVVLAEQLYRKSGQGDLYNVFFCSNDEKFAGKMELRSGGIDSDGIEHVLASMYKPYSTSISLTSDYEGLKSADEIKQETEFIAEREIPRNIKKSEEIILGNVEDSTEVISSRLVARIDQIDEYALHEFEIKDVDGNIQKYYTGAFSGNVVFTKKEMDLLQKKVKARGVIIRNLSDKEWQRLESSGEMDSYLEERVGFSDKERRYYDELDEYYKNLNPIKEEK